MAENPYSKLDLVRAIERHVGPTERLWKASKASLVAILKALRHWEGDLVKQHVNRVRPTRPLTEDETDALYEVVKFGNYKDGWYYGDKATIAAVTKWFAQQGLGWSFETWAEEV